MARFYSVGAPLLEIVQGYKLKTGVLYAASQSKYCISKSIDMWQVSLVLIIMKWHTNFQALLKPAQCAIYLQTSAWKFSCVSNQTRVGWVLDDIFFCNFLFPKKDPLKVKFMPKIIIYKKKKIILTNFDHTRTKIRKWPKMTQKWPNMTQNGLKCLGKWVKWGKEYQHQITWHKLTENC